MLRDVILKEVPIDVVDYISKFVNLENRRVKVLETSTAFNVEAIEEGEVDHVVNIKRANDIEHLNHFFQSVNHKLPQNGLFINCIESIAERKARILNKYPHIISYPYYLFDFFLKRVFPRIKFTRWIYQTLTRGQNKAVSLVEVYGRLITCGFEIVEYKEIKNLTYFVARKIGEPMDVIEPSYGFLIRLPRVGKGGKMIKVYKLRTMHPYAEFLQGYVYDQNDLREGGKIKDDFRITEWGRVLRKLWIDELPMLINWLKRDLKLVGIRPLSLHYYGLYTPELRERRIKYKPGLVPPFYADMPKTLEEIMASEIRYLDAYEKHPILTDVKYFFRAWRNIIFRHARSN